MASNDMNSWDKDPDKPIRRHWQQTFADFEVQSRPSLRRRILGQLPTRPRLVPTRWLVVGGLVMLVGVGLYWRTRVHETTVVRAIGTRHRGDDPTPRIIAPQPETDKPAGRATIVVAEAVRVNSQSDPVPQSVASRRRPASQMNEIWPLKKSVPTLASTRKSRSVIEAESGAQSTPSSRSVSLREAIDSQPNQYATTEPVEVPQRMGHWSTDPLNSTSLILSKNQLPLVIPLADMIQPGKSTVRYSPRRWFIEVAPLSSFQWMSTPPASPVYLSQVKAPAALSPATWGYQLSLGFAFRHWNAQLSAGHLRRWAYYTVEENRYRLEPTLADPYQLVRESYAVAENVLLPMVGVGLSQRRLVGQARYVAELGGQLWYLPTNDQTVLGLRGGVNRRLLSSRAEWQVGLSASYGLNQLLSEHQHMTIHPLIVGFTLRRQPNGKLVHDK